MDGGVILALGPRDSIDHSLRLLRSGSGIEIVPVEYTGEVVAISSVRPEREGCTDIHDNASSFANAAVSSIARTSSSATVSNTPAMNDCNNNVRAVTGSMPREAM